MRAINVLLAIVVSLVIALSVFEGGLRLLGFGPTKTLNQFDPMIGWVKRADASTSRTTDEFEVTFEVNSLGLRDDPMESPDKPEGVYRVVCLGDSFTLGFSVAREDLFVDQLESVWNARGRNVDVINTGTEGYSTDQQVVWMLENGDAYQPDLVLLFSYDNDLYWNGQTEYFGKPKPRFNLSGELDHAGPFEEPEDTGFLGELAITNLFGKSTPTDHRYKPTNGSRAILKEFAPMVLPPTGFITDAVKRTGGALKALKQKCDELGARLVVAPIPSHSAVDEIYADKFGSGALGIESREHWIPDAPVTAVLALCEQNGIESLDGRQALKDAMASTGESMYFKRDWHLNPAGNLAFARFLDEGLTGLGVFPSGHAATAEVVFEPGMITAAAKSGMPRWMAWFMGLWILLTTIYFITYKDDPIWQPPLKVGAMLALIFAIVIGGTTGLSYAPPALAKAFMVLFVLVILGFIVYKLGRRLGTILELLKSFTLRGHWYLMPLVIVLLTIGSLLVVAASSPLVAPFIYTLF
jgi:hypothetical protein